MAACPQCGKGNRRGQQYCGHCGAFLSVEVPRRRKRRFWPWVVLVAALAFVAGSVIGSGHPGAMPAAAPAHPTPTLTTRQQARLHALGLAYMAAIRRARVRAAATAQARVRLEAAALADASQAAALVDTGDAEAVVGACGVERWAVKTGLDADARLVNQKAVVVTTIIHLRALPAPVAPPLRTRVRPVETTVWAVDATLLRFKEEADSDYHLVLADSGGRTMIAEIPAPQCVGASSPFLPAIRAVRQSFTLRFHPSINWQRVNVRVRVSGVGFFDFQHGQSGVAPNAIELHPVLSVTVGGATPAPIHAATSATPTKAPPSTRPTQTPAQASLTVSASVSPDPVSYGDYPTLTATTLPGAICTPGVIYSTGRPPTSLDETAQTVGASGVVSWSWHMESKGIGGTATVSCTLHGRTVEGSTTFTIA